MLTDFITSLTKSLVATIVLTVSTSAFATVVLDMENIAPASGLSSESVYTPRIMNGFVFTAGHGHFIDSGYSSPYSQSNGTDYFLHDDNTSPFEITRVDGGTFSALGFDVANWAGAGMTFSVKGIFEDNTAVTMSFTSDLLNGFETLSLSSAFSNIVKLEFQSIYSNLAYDNIVLATEQDVPEPATLSLIGLGLLGFAFSRSKLKNKVSV